MDKQKHQSTTNSTADTAKKQADDYNFVLKGAKMDII